MRSFFEAKETETDRDGEPDESDSDSDGDQAAGFAGYGSDTSNEDPMDMQQSDNKDEDGREDGVPPATEEPSGPTIEPGCEASPDNQPKRKRRKLDIPVLQARAKAREKRLEILTSALTDIKKLIRSRKTEFQAGTQGLQSYWAQAIDSYLRLVVREKMKGILASEVAAEALGFVKGWGSRQVRRWACVWLNERDLPKSERGCHVKVKSLFEDPEIRAELRTYVRSNPWAMNPRKLQDFTNNKLLPKEAKKYCKQLVNMEMPKGLKKYMELELFPLVHMKAGKGISLSTARRWLMHEGFRYTQHKKAIYYDGHDRPDVVKYRQEVFLPTMAKY